MNVETSFLKDRPATVEELADLSFEIIDAFEPVEYEDVFRVPVSDPNAENEEFEVENMKISREKIDDWYLRMN